MNRKQRREITPADKTQHGDPPPQTEERQGNALTVDELVGRSEDATPAGFLPTAPPVRAVTTGPIGMPKRCADCNRILPVQAATCPDCAPQAREKPLGGVNAIDPTSRAALPPPKPGEPPWYMSPVVSRR